MKLNNKHLKIFKKHVVEYIRLLNLGDWRIKVEFGELDNSNAYVSFDYEGRVACICLCKEVEDTTDVLALIKNCALHECLELFLRPFISHIYDHKINDVLFDAEIHSMISVLEKSLYGVKIRN